MTLKEFIFRLLGKDPEAVVVSFLSGPEPLAREMLAQVRQLVPDREHYAVTDLDIPDVVCIRPNQLPGPLSRKRIGLAPTLFEGDPEFRWIRRAAFRMAPRKVLAFNARLERHHLKVTKPIASWLFLRGVPLDRIFLRPSWMFPFKHDRSRSPDTHQAWDGRPLSEGRARIAILSPYFPYPLSHGGAVRIYNLLKEASRDFDVFLFAFSEQTSVTNTPIIDLCAKVVVFPNPRYREPRWSTLLPPEVREYRSDYVARVVELFRREYDLRVMQVEYTQLASYGGEVLVEHDVTFDLYEQVKEREKTLAAWWDWRRWYSYESRVVRKFSRVVVMSEKDAALIGTSNTRVIPNGVDLIRFHPQPEPTAANLLFVGSFRHFPNVIAYRFFVNEIWPRIGERCPELRTTVIAGPDPHLYWSELPPDPRIQLHGFISDVRPFYSAANIVIVPTQVSAGTNLKVLEAIACGRAVVSTSSGCAGLGLVHGESVWVAETAEDFAQAVLTLLRDSDRRRNMGQAARRHAELHFGWRQLGRAQRRLWTELLTGITVRPGRRADIVAINKIQAESETASHWAPESYFEFDVSVAEKDGTVCGFLVSRTVVGEVEVLNLAVEAARRRMGAGTALLDSIDSGEIFLEVRESNQKARNLYWKMGFRVVGRREEYYENPPEAALVMRLSRHVESDTF